MKQQTREWVDKAEADLATAQREMRARKLPNYDAACFHAQQCAEKYMKAVLEEHDIPARRIHDLSELLNELLSVNASWELQRAAAELLTDYAVRFRYPGNTADRQMARDAVRAAAFVADEFRSHLGLPGRKPPRKKPARRRRKR